MPIKELAVINYRSIRDLRFRLRATNVLTGPNGCGKSNLYNSLFLLSKAATGGLAHVIAEEGGMSSVLWAGKRKSEPVRMTISVATDLFSYSLACGLPTPSSSAFHLDPEVKEEFVWAGFKKRHSGNTMFERGKAGTWARDQHCQRVSYSGELLKNESVLSQLRDPHLYPELSSLSREVANWRFYHHFRTDPHSPLRQPQIGVLTPVLSHDGRDLASALKTIDEIGDASALRETIAQAFGGARLKFHTLDGRFSISLIVPHLERPLQAQEFSDGMLRYLCLVAALLSPRPPSLLALNEPETSLHPDLLAPLAQLIAQSSRQSQLWITTHSRTLAEHIESFSGHPRLALEIVKGETKIVGQGLILPDFE